MFHKFKNNLIVLHSFKIVALHQMLISLTHCINVSCCSAGLFLFITVESSLLHHQLHHSDSSLLCRDTQTSCGTIYVSFCLMAVEILICSGCYPRSCQVMATELVVDSWRRLSCRKVPLG